MFEQTQAMEGQSGETSKGQPVEQNRFVLTDLVAAEAVRR
jgi:hypothetical protein